MVKLFVCKWMVVIYVIAALIVWHTVMSNLSIHIIRNCCDHLCRVLRSQQLSECSYYTVSQKNCATLFLSELHQISTNFDNFGQKGDKEAEIMQDVLIFHLI